MSKPDNKGEAHNGKGYIFPGKKEASRVPTLPGGYFRAGVIALHPASGLLLGAALGYFMDKQFDALWCFPFFLIAGLGVGCLNAYRDIRVMMRGEETKNDRKKPPNR